MPTGKPKLCVSLMPERAEQVQDWLALAGEADIIEFRLDLLPELDLAALRKTVQKPVIITLRHQQEGGQFTGTRQEMIAIYQQAARLGFDYLDMDVHFARQFLHQISLSSRSNLLLSTHLDTANLNRVRETLRQLLKFPAQAYKLVYSARQVNDSLLLFKIQDMLQKKGAPYVVHAMGQAGTPSRLLGALMGNAWTYVSLTPSSRTAEGQFTLAQARLGYHLHRKISPTGLLGLVGYPIEQSKGWLLHNRLIEHFKSAWAEAGKGYRDYLYLNFSVPDFASFWQEWASVLRGISVTIPHKQALAQTIPLRSREVQISGVANTAVRTPEGWKCYNTDLLALESIFRDRLDQLQEGVLILGTGGIARSAIVALKRLEVFPIVVAGRNIQRGEMLAQKYAVDFLPFEDIAGISCSLIFNATPLGMYPRVDEVPPGVRLFKPGRVVFDAVYNPSKTRFLTLAEEKGCETISGVTLFLRQAALQFELFTGVRPGNRIMEETWAEIQQLETL